MANKWTHLGLGAHLTMEAHNVPRVYISGPVIFVHFPLFSRNGKKIFLPWTSRKTEQDNQTGQTYSNGGWAGIKWREVGVKWRWFGNQGSRGFVTFWWFGYRPSEHTSQPEVRNSAFVRGEFAQTCLMGCYPPLKIRSWWGPFILPMAPPFLINPSASPRLRFSSLP